MKALLDKIRKILRDRRTRILLTRLVSGVAAVVVFITTYALVLPAITMESQAACGIEAHQHDDSCYTEELICGQEESEGHHHTEDCYTVTKDLVCSLEEHQHSAENGCYDEDGNLICKLEEHTHTDSCYEEHRELTCGLEETDGHTHTDSCYKKVLTCGKPVHTHSAACYKADPELQSAAVASTGMTSAAAMSDYSEEEYAQEESLDGSIGSQAFDEPEEVGTENQNPGEEIIDEDSSSAETEDNQDADIKDENDDIEISDEGISRAEPENDPVTDLENENADDNSVAAESDDMNRNDGSESKDEKDEKDEKADAFETGDTAFEESADEENLNTEDDENVENFDREGEESASSFSTGFAAEEDEDSYIPEKEALDFNTVLNNTTGIYYHHLEAGETVEDSSVITDWTRVDEDTELNPEDLIRVYLSYTLPADTINATNDIARYRLPETLHLTDEQIDVINKCENGISTQYVDYDKLEISDIERHAAYLGLESVEGTRRPGEELKEDSQEYISATVKADKIYNEDNGEYEGTDLIFTFSPYTVGKNAHTYDKDGQPTKAGEKVTGWLMLDFNLGQVDWTEDRTSEIVFAEEDEENHISEIRTVLRLANPSEDETDDSAADGMTEAAAEYATEETASEYATEEIAAEDMTAEASVADTTAEAATADATEEAAAADNTNEKAEEAGTEATATETAADLNGEKADEEEQTAANYPAAVFDDSITVRSGRLDTDLADTDLPRKTKMTVHVEADEGTFPEGTKMVLSPVEDLNAVAEAVGTAVDSKTRGFQAVDITFYDKDPSEEDAKEIEPLKPIRVSIKSDEIKKAAEDSSTAPVVVHIEDDNTATEIENTASKTDNAAIEIEKPGVEEGTIPSESKTTDDNSAVQEKANGRDNNATDTDADADTADADLREDQIRENPNEETSKAVQNQNTTDADEVSSAPAEDNNEETNPNEDTVDSALREDQNEEADDSVSDQSATEAGEDSSDTEESSDAVDTDLEDPLVDNADVEADNASSEQDNAESNEENTPTATDAEVVDTVTDEENPADNNSETENNSNADPTNDSVNFEADSFSVYAIVYTVDFHYEIDGKMYDFSIPGGGFVSFAHIAEILGIYKSDTDNENTAGTDVNKGESVSENAGEKNGKDHSSPYEETIRLNDVEISGTTWDFLANVESVEFSDPELIWVGRTGNDITVGNLKETNHLNCQYSDELTEEQIKEINAQTVEAGDWAMISMLPFTSEEALTVTMKDGEVFTIYITDGQIKRTVISASGETYEITVTYGEDAQIPDGAELKVREISPEDEEYKELQEKAGDQLQEELKNAIPAHPVLFDISIFDGDKEIEPAEGSSVQVEVKLAKESVSGLFTDEDSPLLINEEPVKADGNELTRKLQIIHDVKEESLEVVDVREKDSEEKITGQFVTESFSNWLLFLDEDLTDITVYKGDSITLRPYGEWYWKKDGEPTEIQNLNWTFPDNEYNVTWDWRYNVPIDYNGNTRNYYGITQAKTNDGKYTLNGYAKYDRELEEYYWYYHAPDLQPGDFTLYVGDNKGNTRTIRVHVIDENGHADDKPGTVSGVNNIAVNLFDYDLGGILDVGPQWISTGWGSGYYDWNNKNHNLANDSNFDNTTINAGHDLKFLSSGSGGKATSYDHGYNGYYSEDVHPGIVKNNLTTEGYPELAYGTDLKYLFDTSKTSWVDGDKMIAYPNVTGLFQQDTSGYYYYNSNINYAYYNPENGNKQVTLYEHTYTQSTTGTLDATGVGENAKPIGFFPFHDYDSTHNLYVNQNKNLNHHLGMSMKLQFDIPQDKQINGEDIIFEFSGDDDLWVFVDGKLVLDMGGIHQPVPGTINFSETSNNVKVYGQSDKSVTFTPGYHTMEVFYLERGGCDSNCSIMFNMPLVIGRGDFKVVKKGDKETENIRLNGAVFGLWETEDCLGDPVRTAPSANNGLVEFNNLSVKAPGQVYYMKEISAPDGYIKSKKVYTVTASNSPGSDGKYTFTIQEKDSSDPLDTITQEPYTPIVYNMKQKPRNITIQKTWQNEFGETINAPIGAEATFALHKKGYSSSAEAPNRTLYKIQLRNPTESVLAQGMFYEGDQIRLKYEFDNSPISTTMSKNGTTYAPLIKEAGDTGPRYVNYTVKASDANTDGVIIFKRENDTYGRSHGFKTVEWELVEAAPVPSVTGGGMEDKIIQTFTLPYNGQWSRTFTNLDTYDAEGNPFMYWFEETGMTNANGYFPVTVTDADHPLDVGQSTQAIKNLKKASIRIIKVVEGTERAIPGAKFTLTQVDENGNTVPSGIQKPEATTNANGILIFDNLEPGRYKLEETVIPDGYIRKEGPYYIVVNSDYTTSLDTSVPHTLITKSETSSEYTVENMPGAALPSTGGPGTRLFTILGSLLLAFGSIVLIRRQILIN